MHAWLRASRRRERGRRPGGAQPRRPLAALALLLLLLAMKPPATLIIGAAGAVGKRLCAALAARGTRVVASDRMHHLPGSLQRVLGESSTTVGGVDVRDSDALKKLFLEHADERTTVCRPWRLELNDDPGEGLRALRVEVERVVDVVDHGRPACASVPRIPRSSCA